MEIKIKLIGLFFCLFAVEICSKELCLQASRGDGFVVGLSQAADALVADAVFDKYMEYAKTNDFLSIKEMYSKEDGSMEYFMSSPIPMAEKFSNYKDIKSIDKEAVFKWGQYTVLLHRYVYGAHAISLGTMFECRSQCFLSNVFERPDDNVDMLSWFLMDFSSGLNRVSCPEDRKIVSIYPNKNISKKNPISIYLVSDFSADGLVDLSGALSAKQLGCINQMKALGGGKADMEVFLQQCTENIDMGTMYPVIVKEGDTLVKKHIDIDIFSRLISGEKAVKYVGDIKYKQWDVVVVVVEDIDNRKYLLAIPFTDRGALVVIDWGFFGTSAGFLMTMPAFGEYVFGGFSSEEK